MFNPAVDLKPNPRYKVKAANEGGARVARGRTKPTPLLEGVLVPLVDSDRMVDRVNDRRYFEEGDVRLAWSEGNATISIFYRNHFVTSADSTPPYNSKIVRDEIMKCIKMRLGERPWVSMTQDQLRQVPILLEQVFCKGISISTTLWRK
jgi:hypothetical protein